MSATKYSCRRESKLRGIEEKESMHACERACARVKQSVFNACVLDRLCCVVHKVGLCCVVQKVGLCCVVQKVGLCCVVQEVGLCCVVQKVGLCCVVQKVGLCCVVQKVGLRCVDHDDVRALSLFHRLTAGPLFFILCCVCSRKFSCLGDLKRHKCTAIQNLPVRPCDTSFLASTHARPSIAKIR